MYYIHDDSFDIISKQSSKPDIENYVESSEDIDITLFRVIVGFIGKDKQMLRHTKILKDVELIAQRFNEISDSQAELAVDTDYRLSLIELGLI
jgi:hypothetical protein